MRIQREKFYKAYLEAPKAVREIAGSPKLSEFLEEAARKYKLNEEKTKELGYIANYALLGFLQPQSIIIELQKELVLSPETAAALEKELHSSILDPVKTSEQVTKTSSSLPPNDKPLVDHIRAYEERKKQKQEEERNKLNTNIQSTLHPGQNKEIEQEHVDEKTRPSEPDPYHEPIES